MHKRKSIFDIEVGDYIEFFEVTNGYLNQVTEVRPNAFKIAEWTHAETDSWISFADVSVEKTVTNEADITIFYLDRNIFLFQGQEHDLHPWKPRRSVWNNMDDDVKLQIAEAELTRVHDSIIFGKIRQVTSTQFVWDDATLRKYAYLPEEIEKRYYDEMMKRLNKN